MLAGVLDEVGRVGVVPDQQRLDFFAAVVVLASHVTNPLHRLPAVGRREVGVDNLGPAAAVIQMVETEAVHANVGQQVDNTLQVSGVALGDCVPEAGFQSRVQAVLYPLDRALERAVDPTEVVVSLRQSVD